MAEERRAPNFLSEEEKREWQARQALNASIGSDQSDAMPTPEELALIGQLHEKFAEDFDKRKAEGRDHSCCFGDLALVRVFRGNDGDFDRTAAWYARFLETYEAEGVESLIVEMTKRLDKAGRASNDILLFNDDLKEYASAIFSLPQLAPTGDAVTYVPVINTDKRTLVDKGLFKTYTSFMRSALILRMIDLDRLSRSQQRIVKVASIFDLAGCSLGWLSCPRFDKEFDQNVGKFSESTGAELYGTFHVINAPWFITKIFRVIQRYIPEKLRKRIFFIEGSPAKDADFMQLVGGPAQYQQMLKFRADFAGVSDKPSGDQEVPRRQIFERCVEVIVGQPISWSFQVLKGTGDLLMGISDIEFEVVAFWSMEEEATPEEGSPATPATPQGLEGEHLVEPVRVSATDGEQKGSIEPSRPGLVVIRWSNAHSMMRGKTIRFAVEGGSKAP